MRRLHMTTITTEGCSEDVSMEGSSDIFVLFRANLHDQTIEKMISMVIHVIKVFFLVAGTFNKTEH